jgi:hypothetical protein
LRYVVCILGTRGMRTPRTRRPIIVGCTFRGYSMTLNQLKVK